MPRQSRVDEAGSIYHVLNRGNCRQQIFFKNDDYDAFLRVLAEGLEKYPVDVFSFALMPNHWHLVVRPNQDGQMGRLFRWVGGTHTLRHHSRYKTRGYGHLYQSRFKSFPVQDDSHFYSVCRFVERNPIRAKLVKSAKLWRHGSLYRWNQVSEPKPAILTPSPIRRLPNWNDRVDEPLSKQELDAFRTSVERGRPYGSDEWVDEVAEKHGLWSTLRPVGRPRKRESKTDVQSEE